MHTFTELDQEQRTRNHLVQNNSRPWYAVAVKAENSATEAIKKGLDKILSQAGHENTGRRNGVIYCASQLSDNTLSRIQRYLQSQKGINKIRILKSDHYGLFAGNPDHWLSEYFLK